MAITDATGPGDDPLLRAGLGSLEDHESHRPFGRSAQFDYDATGKLVRITDVIGLTSEFEYASSDQYLADFITALTTPYGTTTFTQLETERWEVVAASKPRTPWGNESIVYDKDDAYTPVAQQASDDPPTGPRGLRKTTSPSTKGSLTTGASERWLSILDDYTKAKVIRWLRNTTDLKISSAKQSEKEPLENRVWYGYDGITATPTARPTAADPRRIRPADDDRARPRRRHLADHPLRRTTPG